MSLNLPATVHKDYALDDCNTMAVPSIAEFYAQPCNALELLEALHFAKNKKLAQTILGSGSNVVLPDFLVGLCLHLMFSGIEVWREDKDYVWIDVQCGENWSNLVRYCLSHHWYGLENLADIPGSVGAAPVQNIGAYGVELSSFLEAVHILDIDSEEQQTITTADCGFSYRNSAFKSDAYSHKIIQAVRLRLYKQQQPCMHYESLQKHLQAQNILNPNCQQIYEAVSFLRNRLPDVHVAPNVGSFFTNPQLDRTTYEDFIKNHQDVKTWQQADGYYKISAADLLERCGWKGRDYKGVVVHHDHALVITNPKHRLGADIMDCATAMHDSVADRFGVSLAIEPTILV